MFLFNGNPSEGKMDSAISHWRRDRTPYTPEKFRAKSAIKQEPQPIYSPKVIYIILAYALFVALSFIVKICGEAPKQDKTNGVQKNKQKTEQVIDEAKPTKADNRLVSLTQDQQNRYRFAAKKTLFAMGNRDRLTPPHRQVKHMPQKV